ncbi:MAG: hypothetical protein R3C15_00420 [Thermoleophilia bacterium]
MELPEPVVAEHRAVSLRSVAGSLDLEASLFARHLFQHVSGDLRRLFAELPTRHDPIGQEWVLAEDWEDALEPTFCWRYLRELAGLADEAARVWADIAVGALSAPYAPDDELDP